MNTKKSNKKDERARNWCVIVYPDSAPSNWRDIIDDYHIAWIEGPLHNLDVDPDGEVKKPHWHILLLFEGKKSFDQIKEITDKLNAPIPEKAASARGSVRYMAHLDYPDKAQYSISDIVGHGGADVAEFLKPTSSARYQLIGEMIDYVRQNRITEVKDLIDYALDNRPDDWLPLLSDNSLYIMSVYIKSIRHSIDPIPKCDPDTGEVIEE